MRTEKEQMAYDYIYNLIETIDELGCKPEIDEQTGNLCFMNKFNDKIYVEIKSGVKINFVNHEELHDPEGMIKICEILKDRIERGNL